MATPGQVLLGAAILALGGILLALATYRKRYVDLTDEQRRQKRVIEPQLADAKPARWSIPTELWGPEFSDRVAEMFEDEFESPDHNTSFADAYRSVKGEFVDKAGPLARVSKFARWLAQEGVLLLIAGGVSAVSIATLNSWLDSPPDYPSVSSAVSATETLLTTGLDLLFQFPYLGDLLTILFAYLLIGMEILYDNWHYTGVFLLLGAVIIAILHRDLHEDIETKVVARNRRTALNVGGGFLATWAAGVIPTYAGMQLGIPRTGATIGFLFGLGVGLSLVVLGIKLYTEKMVRRVRKRGFKFHGTVFYLIARRVWGTVGILAGPLIAMYWFNIIYSGKVEAVLATLSQAHAHIQALIALTLALVLIGVGWAIRDAMPDIRDAVSDLIADRAARAVMFGWGAPTGVFVFSVMFGVGFRISFPLVIVIAVLASIVSRLLWEAFLRVKYRAETREPVERIPKRIKITARKLHDADNDTIYYATVNGEPLAHREKSELVDAIVRHAAAIREGDDPPATVAGWFARDCVRFGIVDIDETLTKLHRKIRRVTFGMLRRNDNRIEVSELRDELDRYPEWMVDNLLTKWEWSSSGEHSLTRKGNYYTTPQSKQSAGILPSVKRRVLGS